MLINYRAINWQFYNSKGIGPNNIFDPHNNLVFSDDLVIFNSQDNNTYALKQSTGRLVWQFTAQNYSPFPATIINNRVYLANFDGHIYSLDKKTGHELWRFSIPEQINPDTPVVASANSQKVFFATRTGGLYALDSITGQEIWQKQFIAPDNHLALAEGTIHFGSLYRDERYLYAINAPEKTVYLLDQNTGEILWQINDFIFNFNQPLFTNNYVVFSQLNKFVIFDKNTGKQINLIKQGVKNSSWQVIQPQPNEDTVLIIDDQKLTKIDLRTNGKVWNADGVFVSWLEKENVKTGQTPVYIYNNQILVQRFNRLTSENTLQAIDYSTGKVIWEETLPIGLIDRETRHGETLILGGKTGHLVGINANNGEIEWQTKLTGKIDYLATKKDNLLIITQDASEKNNFYYLDLQKSGQIIWKYNSDHLINQSNTYATDQAIYTLDEQKQLLEKVEIKVSDPENKNFEKLNFFVEQNLDLHDPYLKYQLKEPLSWKIKKLSLQTTYVAQHFLGTRNFEIQQEISAGRLEFEINHDEQLYQNPFVVLDISAIFTNKKTGEKFAIKGYYYDKDTWKLRFKPSENAEYSWRLLIKSPFGRKIWSGSEELTIDRFQSITTGDNNFVVGDTTFFPMGIQDAFIDRNYDGSFTDQISASLNIKPATSTDDFRYLSLAEHLEIFKNEAGINIFRYGVDNWAPSLYQSLNPEKIEWNINGAHFGDKLLAELKDRNIHVIMTIFGFYPPFDSKEEIKKPANRQAITSYLDYVIARFGSEIDLWEISNEARSDQDWYKFVISYLKNNDPYHHPISTNWESPDLENLDYLSAHWYNQNTGSSVLLNDAVNFIKTSYTNYSQPILISELGFKNLSWFAQSDEAVRVLVWLNTFNEMGIIFWNQG
ncbi:MAG: PQQ-binding-like beta-propeller repeat protein, partial [Candidatus Paceibacterota bacterium]